MVTTASVARNEGSRPKPTAWQTTAVDLLSAACASALVSPWVTAIDVVVVRKAATGASLWSTIRSFLRKPSKPPIGCIIIPWLVYFGTYSAANISDSINAAVNDLSPSTPSSTGYKFLATTTISTGLCVYKDGYFAKLLGTSTVKKAVPRLSFALFTARDAVTVFACFNMPGIIAPKLPELLGTSPIASLVQSEEASLNTAQMIMPAAIQIVSTPIHLLGLDINNRRAKLPVRERLSLIGQHMPAATPLRMMRIIPAFGIGSVANTGFRRYWMAQLQEEGN